MRYRGCGSFRSQFWLKKNQRQIRWWEDWIRPEKLQNGSWNQWNWRVCKISSRSFDHSGNCEKFRSLPILYFLIANSGSILPLPIWYLVWVLDMQNPKQESSLKKTKNTSTTKLTIVSLTTSIIGTFRWFCFVQMPQ